ncbi:unnamed protein product [Symbiodinium sp. KB8]|nr:unnamed protein product [Symbiodinium sp. KB8]
MVKCPAEAAGFPFEEAWNGNFPDVEIIDALQKRGACLGPAFQYLEVNRRRQRVMSASAPDAIQWLVSLSGARCSSRHLCLPKSRQEGSRTELEAKALARGTKPSSGHPD